MTRLRSEIRTVARGWRWGRAPAQPASAPAPKVARATTYDTDWARKPASKLARAVVQEAVMLPGLRVVARPTVHGRDRLRDVPQPAIIVANHTSHLDTALIIEAMPLGWRDRVAVGAAADYFFSDRIRGTGFALAIGAFPVERTQASAASARLALRLASEGWNLILFPEGGRSSDGWMQELKPGAAFVASRTGRPLVPVWIEGTEHIWPKGRRFPRPGRTQVLIGDPVVPALREDPRALNVRLEQAMRRVRLEAQQDWWTAMRDEGPDPRGPQVAHWRRVWARGDAPGRPRSRWP